nr:hypothetical protein [Tanacetum cinerariifolium]
MMASSHICLLSKASKTKSWLWHQRLSHLNFGAFNNLVRQGLVREAVDTACYTQNRSIVYLRYGKTPYELLHGKLPDLSLILESSLVMNPQRRHSGFTTDVPDELLKLFMSTISSGLVPKSTSSTPFVPPSRNDWDMLFQPLVDELLTPPPSVDPSTPEVIAPIADVIAPEPAESTGLPSSTTVDQNAPLLSKSQTTLETQPPVIPHDVEEDNHDIEVAHMGNDPLFGHPIENIIGQLTRPVSTRMQLHEQALFFYYDAFLTYVKPKTYKDALTQSCWIEAMQEELNEFECLETAFLNGNLREEVYVSQPDRFMDPDNPNHVYKLKKALCGLKQAPRAWYDILSSFLISQDFSKGSVDPTLFIRRNGNNLLLISQSPRGIFINQSKYALESLKKYDFNSCDPVDTPMVEKSKLDEDKEGKAVDLSYYRAFADMDHAGCQDTCHSTSGSLQFLGDRFISWSKHIDIRYHFIKEHVENGVIKLYFVNTEYQLAVIFTKLLAEKELFLINKLGMRSFTPEILKQLTDEVDE